MAAAWRQHLFGWQREYFEGRRWIGATRVKGCGRYLFELLCFEHWVHCFICEEEECLECQQNRFIVDRKDAFALQIVFSPSFLNIYKIFTRMHLAANCIFVKMWNISICQILTNYCRLFKAASVLFSFSGVFSFQRGSDSLAGPRDQTAEVLNFWACR